MPRRRLWILWASLGWIVLRLRTRYGDRRLTVTALSLATVLIVVATSALTLGEIAHLRAASHQQQVQQQQAVTATVPGLPHVAALTLSNDSEVLAWVACTGTGSTCSAVTVRPFHPTGPVALIWVCEPTSNTQLPSGVIGATIFGPAGTPPTHLSEYCPSDASAQAASGVLVENFSTGNYVLTITHVSAPTWFLLVVQIHV